MNKPLIDQAVDRFLGWKLPQDFNPDCGISFTIPINATWFPTGTNLFHAGQTKAMLEHVAAPLFDRIAELEALHRTYYNQPFAEACQQATLAERERCIDRALAWWAVTEDLDAIPTDVAASGIRAALQP